MSLKKDNNPHIIILDDIEYFSDTSLYRSDAAALWQLLEKYRNNKSVYLIGVVTDPEEPAQQVKSKFDVETISLPDEKARAKALAYYMNQKIEAGVVFDCDQSYIKKLSKRTEGFTFFCLEHLINNARRNACSEGNEQRITADNFEYAFGKYDEKEKTFGRGRRGWGDTAKTVGAVVGILTPPVVAVTAATMLNRRLARLNNN